MRTIETIEVNCNSCGGSNYEEVGRSRDFLLWTAHNEFLYVRCSECGLVYLKNRPVLSELRTIYPATYCSYDYNKFLGPVLSKIRDVVQKSKIGPIARYLGPGGTIVDVGCGSGDLLRILKKYGDPTWRLVGVDMAEESMKHLARLGIEGRQGRFETLEWVDEAPKAIVMLQVIEHLEDPKGAINKAYSLLKPGGLLVVETPSVDGSWDFALFRARYWGGWHAPRHWNLYSAVTLTSVLRRVGFEIAETSFILNPYSWIHSFQYWVSDYLGMGTFAKTVFSEKFMPSLVAFSCIDVVQKIIRGRTSNMRVVGRKPK